MRILQTAHLTKQYVHGTNLINALDDVNLSIEQGEFIAITGASGSGKSTLFHILAGLGRPTSGRVIIDKFDLRKLSADDLTVFRRRRVGFISAKPLSYNLVPVLNVYENLILPILLDAKEPDDEFIQKLVSLLGLEKNLRDMPGVLSDNQRLRVAIARALAAKPAILLMDEPSDCLDDKDSEIIIDLLNVINKKFHQTILMMTKNLKIAEQTDRCLFLKDGRLLNKEMPRVYFKDIDFAAMHAHARAG